MKIVIYADEQGKQPFVDWVEGLKDVRGRAQIKARVTRVAAGNFGDCKALRESVSELRVDVGPGYRVYLSRQGPVVVVLLCAGDKSDQARDIGRAVEFLENWKQRGRP